MVCLFILRNDPKGTACVLSSGTKMISWEGKYCHPVILHIVCEKLVCRHPSGARQFSAIRISFSSQSHNYLHNKFHFNWFGVFYVQTVRQTELLSRLYVM